MSGNELIMNKAINAKTIDSAVASILDRHDELQGGFSLAPKFPDETLLFLFFHFFNCFIFSRIKSFYSQLHAHYVSEQCPLNRTIRNP